MNVYLGLGSNLGNKLENLRKAEEAISKACGKILERSSIYESTAWGFESSERFYNSVILLETDQAPENLLAICKKIEVEIGRKEKTRIGYESRVIDIDLLLCEEIEIDTINLKIPHPLIDERMFVLQPLVEVLALKQNSLHVVYYEKLVNCLDKSVLKIVKP